VKIEEAEEEFPSPLTTNRTEERMAESAIASSTAESERARNEACEHKRAEAWKQTTSSLKEMQARATRRRQRGQSFGPPSYAQQRNEAFDFGGFPGVNTQDTEDEHW
jgi:hypothetical protein